MYKKYSNDKLILLQYPSNKQGEEFTIPDNVVEIGSGNRFWGETVEPYKVAAFSNCKDLKKLVIPKTVNVLEESAFYGEIPVLYVSQDSPAHIFADRYNFEYILIEGTETDDISYGDVNGDGKITAKDSMTVQRYAIKLAELSEEQFKAADVDNDGKVTAKDALYILRCAINLAVLNKFHE
ncbi:MAG: dockerin type I domain-containing protein [Acutalibacteraceae bacterium]|nr:dockerin type I domain-containing protein [Acutalibacteraceae bacterium]